MKEWKFGQNFYQPCWACHHKHMVMIFFIIIYRLNRESFITYLNSFLSSLTTCTWGKLMSLKRNPMISFIRYKTVSDIHWPSLGVNPSGGNRECKELLSSYYKVLSPSIRGKETHLAPHLQFFCPSQFLIPQAVFL